MNKKGLEWKVGLFVAISLVAAAALILRFSKGAGLFTSTYVLHIEANNVGGIVPGANVLMAGVPIGSITTIDLGADGRSVVMHAKILSKYRIRKDAIFSIRQSSFLGDRFIAVTPSDSTKNNVDILKNGEMVQSQEAFDIAEVARLASGLMQRLEQTVLQFNRAVARMDTNLLSVDTLTNLTSTLLNFRTVSERTLVAVDNINSLVETNTPALSASMTNLQLFTEKLNRVTAELTDTVVTNRGELTHAIQNINTATGKLNGLLDGIQAGNGVAGLLLKNAEMANNLSIVVSNFAVLSSNINHQGLWGVIRKPKESKN